MIIDIEKTFLERTLQEELYTKLPEVLDKIHITLDNDVCKRNKAIYGLVQASTYFYNEITNFLTKVLLFVKCETEPFILKLNEVYIVIYVDNILFCGPTN